jgi:hypothetical protein
LGLDWKTTVAVLAARPRDESEGGSVDLDELQKDFEKLTPPVAQRLLRFWQSGQAAPSMRAKTPVAAAPAPAVAQAETPAQADVTEVVVLQI